MPTSHKLLDNLAKDVMTKRMTRFGIAFALAAAVSPFLAVSAATTEARVLRYSAVLTDDAGAHPHRVVRKASLDLADGTSGVLTVSLTDRDATGKAQPLTDYSLIVVDDSDGTAAVQFTYADRIQIKARTRVKRIVLFSRGAQQASTTDAGYTLTVTRKATAKE